MAMTEEWQGLTVVWPEAMEDWRGMRRRFGWFIWSAQISSRTSVWSQARAALWTENDHEEVR
jgi:hypothetical protein